MLKQISARLPATVTLLSSVIHNGDRVGNQAIFHRTGMVAGDGTVLQVPTITGNSFRGQLRDALALDLYETIQVNDQVAVEQLDLFSAAMQGEVRFSKFHNTILAYMLWSGGALTKDVISDEQIARLRELLPGFALLGGGMGNTIVSGKMDVGMFVPICRETAHLIPHRSLFDVSMYDMMQNEAYTRMDDSKNILLSGIFQDPDVPTQQMRFEIETMMAGTMLDWHIALHRVSELEYGAFVTALSVWQRRAVMGGMGRVGHGLCRMSFDNGWVVSPTECVLPQDAIDLYRQHLLAHKDEILAMMLEK